MGLCGNVAVPVWIQYWLACSAVLVVWDAGYCLLRPFSMEGGSLFALFKPYKFYGTIDRVYGPAAWESGDGFCAAQALMNCVEVSLQLTALWLWRRQRSPSPVCEGTLVAFTAQLMTLSKTVLYWLMEFLGGWHSASSGQPRLLVFLVYYLPNSLWLVFPALVVTVLGNVLLEAVRQPGLRAPPGDSVDKEE